MITRTFGDDLLIGQQQDPADFLLRYFDQLHCAGLYDSLEVCVKKTCQECNKVLPQYPYLHKRKPNL